MPYIKQEIRNQLDEEINLISNKIKSFSDDEKEGILNYTISRILSNSLPTNQWRYKYINRTVGILECIKLEFYRRLAAPYENNAIKTNKDIPEYDKEIEIEAKENTRYIS